MSPLPILLIHYRARIPWKSAHPADFHFWQSFGGCCLRSYRQPEETADLERFDYPAINQKTKNRPRRPAIQLKVKTILNGPKPFRRLLDSFTNHPRKEPSFILCLSRSFRLILGLENTATQKVGSGSV